VHFSGALLFFLSSKGFILTPFWKYLAVTMAIPKTVHLINGSIEFLD